ncbi:kinase-like protein [Fistulina hepatica ATCC 64428]|uniref:Kinase-like protein n=1 Tax=Fistulina hepatica ATCC 64428 TaxID=1128425 RepID=A0A0D7AQ23_9AGAR|nr:kinase-like protein [Fistulina hepatica ATCC 64428]
MSSTEQTVRKEIAVMKTCQHINLVKLFEVIDDIQHDRIYLAMELVSGGPIPWRTASDEPVLTIDQTRRIIRDVILGLDYLHYHGIIHRDIKPSNIMWSEDRVAKIIDFGVSHYIHEGAAPGQSCLHLEDDVIFPEKDLKRTIGTPKFIAPEVVCNLPAAAAARPPITKAIDVWALGVTFYCLLFGKTPFNVSSNSNTHSRHSEYILYKTSMSYPDMTYFLSFLFLQG